MTETALDWAFAAIFDMCFKSKHAEGDIYSMADDFIGMCAEHYVREKKLHDWGTVPGVKFENYPYDPMSMSSALEFVLRHATLEEILVALDEHLRRTPTDIERAAQEDAEADPVIADEYRSLTEDEQRELLDFVPQSGSFH